VAEDLEIREAAATELTKQAAAIHADAKQALTDATAEAAAGHTLASWQKELNLREQAVTALGAKLNARDDAVQSFLVENAKRSLA
jgi:hypothetical protein